MSPPMPAQADCLGAALKNSANPMLARPQEINCTAMSGAMYISYIAPFSTIMAKPMPQAMAMAPRKELAMFRID